MTGLSEALQVFQRHKQDLEDELQSRSRKGMSASECKDVVGALEAVSRYLNRHQACSTTGQAAPHLNSAPNPYAALDSPRATPSSFTDRPPGPSVTEVSIQPSRSHSPDRKEASLTCSTSVQFPLPLASAPKDEMAADWRGRPASSVLIVQPQHEMQETFASKSAILKNSASRITEPHKGASSPSPQADKTQQAIDVTLQTSDKKEENAIADEEWINLRRQYPQLIQYKIKCQNEVYIVQAPRWPGEVDDTWNDIYQIYQALGKRVLWQGFVMNCARSFWDKANHPYHYTSEALGLPKTWEAVEGGIAEKFVQTIKSLTREYIDVQGITSVEDWLFRSVVASESYRLYRNRRIAQEARENKKKRKADSQALEAIAAKTQDGKRMSTHRAEECGLGL